jgi:hypothetical protein
MILHLKFHKRLVTQLTINVRSLLGFRIFPLVLYKVQLRRRVCNNVSYKLVQVTCTLQLPLHRNRNNARIRLEPYTTHKHVVWSKDGVS